MTVRCPQYDRSVTTASFDHYPPAVFMQSPKILRLIEYEFFIDLWCERRGSRRSSLGFCTALASQPR